MDAGLLFFIPQRLAMLHNSEFISNIIRNQQRNGNKMSFHNLTSDLLWDVANYSYQPVLKYLLRLLKKLVCSLVELGQLSRMESIPLHPTSPQHGISSSFPNWLNWIMLKLLLLLPGPAFSSHSLIHLQFPLPLLSSSSCHILSGQTSSAVCKSSL